MMEEDMKTMLRQMVSSFEATELVDRKLAIREVLQELILYGLSKAGFFDKAAFVGGTALRIFHGLRRFSEDLDFMVTEPVSIDFNDYIPEMKRQLSVVGIEVEVSEEERSNPDLVAGMVKGNTKELYLYMYSEDDLVRSIYKKELVRVKIEISTQYSDKAKKKIWMKNMPYPYSVTLFDLPTLFAGKIHAVLCRGWEGRIKGRDLYDFLFYANRGSTFNLGFLNDKFRMSGYSERDLTHEEVIERLVERFSTLDYESARKDAVRFIRGKQIWSINQWCPELFIEVAKELVCEDEYRFS